MPPELRIPMREEAPRELVEEKRFQPARSSKFERRIIETFCEPFLKHIPESVHPNTISLLTHVAAWVTAALAVVSVHLPPAGKSIALLGAGVGMLTSMIGDCLDGMHARRTDQCSKLGEMMDHWLDAIVVPLAAVGMTFSLEMAPWAIVGVNITTAMVYHGQLVLYHHTGKYIRPDFTNGVEVQFGVSIGYVAMAVFFYLVDRHTLWLDVAIGAISVLALLVQIRCNWFYYARLKGLVRYHLIFVALCWGFGALYLLGAMGAYAFALTLVFVSFRISGNYVLYTIIKQRYDGNDYGIALWIAAIVALHYGTDSISRGPLALQALLPYLACLYMLCRNGYDFFRHYGELKRRAA